MGRSRATDRHRAHPRARRLRGWVVLAAVIGLVWLERHGIGAAAEQRPLERIVILEGPVEGGAAVGGAVPRQRARLVKAEPIARRLAHPVVEDALNPADGATGIRVAQGRRGGRSGSGGGELACAVEEEATVREPGAGTNEPLGFIEQFRRVGRDDKVNPRSGRLPEKALQRLLDVGKPVPDDEHYRQPQGRRGIAHGGRRGLPGFLGTASITLARRIARSMALSQPLSGR